MTVPVDTALAEMLAETLESCLPDENGEYDDDTPLVLANVIARLRAPAAVPARSPDGERCYCGYRIDLFCSPRNPNELTEALERISEQQQTTLRMIKDNGFVFDSVGCGPGNWQHLAFTLYTDLCEVDTIARGALASVTNEGER